MMKSNFILKFLLLIPNPSNQRNAVFKMEVKTWSLLLPDKVWNIPKSKYHKWLIHVAREFIFFVFSHLLSLSENKSSFPVHKKFLKKIFWRITWYSRFESQAKNGLNFTFILNIYKIRFQQIQSTYSKQQDQERRQL